MRNYLSILVLFFFVSCKNERLNIQPIITDYFPKCKIHSYSTKSNNGIKSLYINNEYQEKISLNKFSLWDSTHINLPKTFKPESFDTSRKLRQFKRDQKKLTVQLIQDNVDDSFDFFIEIYNHAIANNYDFNLQSSVFFKTDKNDFVVYELILTVNGKTNHILGLISRKRKSLFFDIGYMSDLPMTNLDRYYFTELINSLEENNSYIIPKANNIKSKENINVN